jgi:hypothetical protein
VAASEIQNLKKSLIFFKNAKNCSKKFSPFSGKVGRLFLKTAFFAEK